MKDKRDLLRIVRTPEHALALDLTGKAPGRGAYLCKDMICWQGKPLSKDMLGHALKASITPADWENLRTNLSEVQENRS
jgi:predicted RNA-binding protein YlxR (DUF448 family)